MASSGCQGTPIQDETERRLERGRDFRGHRDAAARQRQYDGIQALVSLKRSCELLSGLGPVPERHDGLFALAGAIDVYAGVAALAFILR